MEPEKREKNALSNLTNLSKIDAIFEDECLLVSLLFLLARPLITNHVKVIALIIK